ncbi:Pentatricopeptide repeat-containing protein At4g25270, chloroplastic, partial [Ancistrocladus abbreviatus]
SHNRQTPRTSLSFPKSSPTPLLLTNQKPQIETKLQALDAVVNDLEASVKNGVNVIDTGTFSSLLETCFRLHAINHGIRIHRLIPPKILRKNVGVASKLLRLYASNGRIEEAHQVFDHMSRRDKSAFVWNSLISGYADLGRYEDAVALYFQMEEEGVEPDRFTFPRALKACGGIGSIHVGEEIHRHVVRYGFLNDVFVQNALVGMYAKCGDIVKARKVFDKIVSMDLVSWNSMIAAYIHHGILAEAIDVLLHMLEAGFEPDEITLSSILKGDSSLRLGGQIHGWVLRRGVQWSLLIANSLIAFYSYHGKLDQACWLFSHMPGKDVVSWNSIISAHCKRPKALTYFQQMQQESIQPDSVTFLSVLSACANLGFVSAGEHFFSLMREEYEIVPNEEHYACMVNLYGRAGLIDKAYEIVTRKVELEADPAVWGALLYASYLHNNIDIGEVAAQKLFELEPDNGHNFELLMKIYESLGRTDDMETVRKMMVDRGLGS